MSVMVKLGFVPSYRNRWSDWAEDMRAASLEALGKISGIEVVAPDAHATAHGAVQNLDDAETVAEQFAREKIDGLVLCPVDFGDERSACKIAEKLGVPVLLYATKEPPAVQDASLARVSDSYCGNLSMASGLHRRGIPFRFAGIFFPDEPELATELDDFARACAVVKGLRNARLGHIGVRPATFETVGYDEAALIRKFGQNVVYANLSDLVDAAKRMPDDDPAVLDLVESMKAEVAAVTVADDYLINSAKLELALVNFWEKQGLSAMAMQCWPSIQRELGISLCAMYGRLTGRHMLTACEVDVLGAMAMLVNYQAALGLALPHFIDWTIQHRDDDNVLLTWHCGNAPVCLADSPDKTALRSRGNMTGALDPEPGDGQAGLYQFQVRPGEVTFCRLQEQDGEWKMLIATGEIEASDEDLAGTWGWVRVSDHAKLYRTLVEEGFIHHASMIHGNQTAALLQACKFLDIEPVVVD